ncbi:hypothetical protein EDC56_1046 [Sinobacterium caligoides]|uniref:Uncharacterized protein n=1 Tax=Sinobacterium caligoides TaxID=933926 RepID=A0A3N2E1S1_9GAMM|nr:hypothetical protein EDC56_1046 [Sinobacterium caligoides]
MEGVTLSLAPKMADIFSSSEGITLGLNVFGVTQI